jgi:hypothetical protein
VPYLPIVGSDGTFQFTGAQSGGWFDPATAYGFHYLASGGTLFSSIQFPTGSYSTPFNLLDGSNNLIGTFNPGDSYSFSTPLSEFSITNINPLVDPTSPTAFPLQITFTTPTGNFTMDALSPPPPPTGGTSTPEPASALLTLGGALMVPFLARKLRHP